MTRRTLVLIVVLALMLGTAAANNALVNRLERSLDPMVASEIEATRQHSEKYNRPLTAIAHKTVVARDYFLFGDATGKVCLYIQRPDGSSEGHIEVIEIHYRKEGDSWRRTDSAVCASEECTREGLALIRALDDHAGRTTPTS